MVYVCVLRNKLYPSDYRYCSEFLWRVNTRQHLNTSWNEIEIDAKQKRILTFIWGQIALVYFQNLKKIINLE